MITLTKFDIVSCCIILILISISVYRHINSKSELSSKLNTLGVKTLIEQVRSELLSIQKNQVDGVNRNLFQLKDFDLEIKFIVNEKQNVSGKAEFEVVTIGGDNTITNEKVQTIKLHMTTFPSLEGEVGPSEQKTEPVEKNQHL